MKQCTNESLKGEGFVYDCLVCCDQVVNGDIYLYTQKQIDRQGKERDFSLTVPLFLDIITFVLIIFWFIIFVIILNRILNRASKMTYSLGLNTTPNPNCNEVYFENENKQVDTVRTRRKKDENAAKMETTIWDDCYWSNAADPVIIVKDILGNEWQAEKSIDENGAYIGNDKFNIHLNLPKGAVSPGHNNTVYMSVHTDMSRIREKLKLENNSSIVAAVPEFQMKKETRLKEYATISLPFCKEIQSTDLIVKCFSRSKNPSDDVSLQEVKKLKTFSDHSEDMSIFCVEGEGGKLHIYTKHFSGIVCTTCNEHLSLSMHARLYQQFVAVDNFLSLKLIIAGHLTQLQGFPERIDESVERHVFVDSVEIDLVENQEPESTLQFRLYIIGQSSNSWEFAKRLGADEVLYHEMQQINISDKMTCGSEHRVDKEIQWLLERREPYRNNISLYVDITNFRNPSSNEGVSDKRRTTMHALLGFPDDS